MMVANTYRSNVKVYLVGAKFEGGEFNLTVSLDNIPGKDEIIQYETTRFKVNQVIHKIQTNSVVVFATQIFA